MLREIEKRPELYAELDETTSAIVAGVPDDWCVNRVGSMFTIFMQSGPVRNYEEAKKSDTTLFGQFFHYLLDNGVYFPPSQFEAAFSSFALTAEDVAHTAEVIGDFFPELAA